MQDQFVPYELALRLKELGFNEYCLGYYTHNEKLCRYDSQSTNVEFVLCVHENIYSTYCLATSFRLFVKRNQFRYNFSIN